MKHQAINAPSAQNECGTILNESSQYSFFSIRYAGFTLVEIMIVVAIISVLAAVAIPVYARYRRDSQREACLVNMRTLHTAAESWRLMGLGGSKLVPEISDIVGLESDKLIHSDPESFKCPTGASYTLSIGDDDETVVSCGYEGEGHEFP